MFEKSSLNSKQLQLELSYESNVENLTAGTVNANHLYRKGDVCVINLQMVGINLVGSGAIIGYLPEKFRPVKARFITCQITYNGNNVIGRIALNPSGEITQAYGSGTLTAIFLYEVYLK